MYVLRKRKGSPSSSAGAVGSSTAGPTRRKRKTPARLSGAAKSEVADDGSESSEEGGTALSSTREHVVAGRGMFSQYFSQTSSSRLVCT